MFSRSAVADLPHSECRRGYFKPFVTHLRAGGFTVQQANDAVRGVMEVLQSCLMQHGEPVDLGFMKLVAKRKSPQAIRYHLQKKRLPKEEVPIHIVGERYVWRVHFHKSWLDKHRPDWRMV